VHSIIVAIVLLLVVHPTIAANLSAVCEQKVRRGSHADFLMNVLLNLTEQETFWPSLACIFRLLAPNGTSFWADTAMRVLEPFEKICANEKVVAPLFLDVFVAIL
jgi:hypothetical protein